MVKLAGGPFSTQYFPLISGKHMKPRQQQGNFTQCFWERHHKGEKELKMCDNCVFIAFTSSSQLSKVKNSVLSPLTQTWCGKKKKPRIFLSNANEIEDTC